MNIKNILEIDSKKDCLIEYIYIEEWKQVNYQIKGKEVDPNDLPVLDDKYICDDNGELLFNNKDVGCVKILICEVIFILSTNTHQCILTHSKFRILS